LTESFNQSSTAAAPAPVSSASDLIPSEIIEELEEDINSLHLYFQSFQPMNAILTSSDFTCGSRWISAEAISLHGYPQEDFQLIFQRLAEIKEKFGLSRVTMEAHVKCRDYLNDIKDSKEVPPPPPITSHVSPSLSCCLQLMGLVASQLLEWYMKVSFLISPTLLPLRTPHSLPPQSDLQSHR
jgi:hypothetical protein